MGVVHGVSRKRDEASPRLLPLSKVQPRYYTTQTSFGVTVRVAGGFNFRGRSGGLGSGRVPEYDGGDDVCSEGVPSWDLRGEGECSDSATQCLLLVSSEPSGHTDRGTFRRK